jgi:hypothetical protein
MSHESIDMDLATHTFWRTGWLWPLFLLGTYNTWFYNPFDDNLTESSGLLMVVPPVFIAYLGWDMYIMLQYKHLYRTDLVIHHGLCLYAFSCFLYYHLYKIGSLFMICESISLLNYVLRDRPNWLNYYRLFIVFCIRMPIWIVFIYSHINHFGHYIIVNCYLARYGTAFFIIYDIVIIQKTLDLMKRKNV